MTQHRSKSYQHASPEKLRKVPSAFWKTVHAKSGRVILVYIVDGAWIRQNIDVGWIGGGHGLIDKYIPANTIWLERGFSKPDLLAFLVHELHEYDLMEAGGDYEKAHEAANEVEAAYRRSVLKERRAKVKTEGDL